MDRCRRHRRRHWPHPATLCPLLHSERLQLVCRGWAKKFATESLLSTQLAVHARKLESCPKNKWQRQLAARGRHTEELTLYTSSKAAQQHGSAYGGAYDEDDYGEEEYDRWLCGV